MVPNSFLCPMHLYITVCDFWFPPFVAYTRTFSLFTLTLSFITGSSEIVSAVMISSFIPLMNNSFSLLLSYMYLHSMSIILNLPIHSSAVS